MRKILLVSILGLFLLCCKKETTVVTANNSDDSISTVKQDTIEQPAPWVSKNQAFLDKFRAIELDSTLFVSPDYDSKSLGPKLTPEDLKLFPKSLSFDGFTGPDIEGFEAFTKFDISENIIGIIAKLPGEYSFTSLKLFFYDTAKDEILPTYFEVADKLGDAGYSEEIKSWLWQDGSDLKALTYKWTKIEKVDPDDRTPESRTDDYYLIKLNPAKIDTSKVSKINLEKYRNLINPK